MLEGLPMRLSNFLKPENVFLQDFVAKQEEGEKIFPEMLLILKKMQNRVEGVGGHLGQMFLRSSQEANLFLKCSLKNFIKCSC
jgi:hypothetical protein